MRNRSAHAKTCCQALATYNRSPWKAPESLPWLPGKVGRGYPWQTVIIADISRSYMRMIERILISLGCLKWHGSWPNKWDCPDNCKDYEDMP